MGGPVIEGQANDWLDIELDWQLTNAQLSSYLLKTIEIE